MKVGVLGSGEVGQSIARGFAGRGHEVKIGSRTPGKPELTKWKKEAGAKARPCLESVVEHAIDAQDRNHTQPMQSHGNAQQRASPKQFLQRNSRLEI